MIRATLLGLLVAAPILAAPAFAAGPPDPDWPCIQRRQPHLSMAQVWGGPVPTEAELALARTDEVQAAAHVIALRRTPMPEAEATIAAFAASHAGEGGTPLVALFAAAFEHVNLSRDRVMAGITRYAHKQEALEGRIEALRRHFAALEAAEPKDFDAIDAAERELDWSMRIFQDRQQSLTYVCETPVILEQRAFALGRAVEALLPK